MDESESFEDYVERMSAAPYSRPDAPAWDGRPSPRKTPLLHHLPRLADHVVLSSLRLRGYKSQRVRTSVGRLHVLSRPGKGTLPPVVVLHGLSAAGQYYANLMRRLRPAVKQVIALDMPGHGYSELPAAGLNHDTLGAGLR